MASRYLCRLAVAAGVLCLAALAATASARAAEGPVPLSVSDYDGGTVYWVWNGRKQPYHGMREAWVFNRAMVWLDEKAGVDGAVICHASTSPLLLTGSRQVSRWYAGKANEVADADEEFTRFVKKDAALEFDHVSLPPLQFAIEQTPTAELEVREATHPWQLLVVVKGRSGPPLYAGPWREGPGTLTVDLLDLYRRKGYSGHYGEFHFAVATRTPQMQDRATVVFRLRLAGRAAVVPSLPVIRTADRAAREGVPIYAVVLDDAARRLSRDTVEVTASVGPSGVRLADVGGGVWKGVVRDLPRGDHTATIRAVWHGGGHEPVSSALRLRVTDGRFLGYDAERRLLTDAGRPIGPITGSYRGAPMFKAIGTPGESLVQGQAQWDAVKGDRHEGQYFNHGGADYGFHFWESLTDREFDADYAYLGRCGWTVVHLCQGWWVWERLDAGGRLAPHGAEQLALALSAADRHGLRLHLALSHYPLGRNSAPYAQYLEAGYKPGDYGRTDSAFYAMFRAYLGDFCTVFRDETAISSFTAAGEGDVDCGKTFVNAVNDFMQARAPNHLFLCEPHLNPRPYPRDMNDYRRQGWRPLLGGMRTYMIDGLPAEHIGVQFKLGATGHIFLGEGVFWGFMDAPRRTDRYRRRIRREFYTGLVYRSPIQLSWEERVVEDERVVFEQVRQAVDWSRPFRRPGLVLRVGNGLDVLPRYERRLSAMPLEYAFILKDDPVPPGTRHVLDTGGPFAAPAFASDGGTLPETLRAEMPLRLPAGFAANYSWSEDRRVLLAYLHGGETEAPPTGDATTEAGHYTYADTARVVPRDTLIGTWEVECVRPGAIRLLVFRRQGGDLVLVGRSEMVEMAKAGPCRFTLAKPIAAKKGDLLGLYIPGPGTHVAADAGGRMLFLEGREPADRLPLDAWQTEGKTVRLVASSGADEARSEPRPSAPAPGIVVQNFPAGTHRFRLYDLDARTVIRQGEFEKGCTLAVPADSRDLFLLVGGRD